MNPQELQQGKQYIYKTVPHGHSRHVFTYTGTARDVKDLMHWFFTMTGGTTTFMSQSEVKNLIEIQKTLEENNKEFGELYDADPLCYHELDENCFSGIRCKHCLGWYCL